MFRIDDDYTINLTRGDIAFFAVDAIDEDGKKYVFHEGDVVRIKVTEKKACENVMLQKDVVVDVDTEQVEIYFNREDSKFGDVISKPTDFWYEIELNPDTNPQTILGYDEVGAKIIKLYPEGKDIDESVEATPEDVSLMRELIEKINTLELENQKMKEDIETLMSGKE